MVKLHTLSKKQFSRLKVGTKLESIHYYGRITLIQGLKIETEWYPKKHARTYYTIWPQISSGLYTIYVAELSIKYLCKKTGISY